MKIGTVNVSFLSPILDVSRDDEKFGLAARRMESKHGRGWLYDVLNDVKHKNKHASTLQDLC